MLHQRVGMAGASCSRRDYRPLSTLLESVVAKIDGAAHASAAVMSEAGLLVRASTDLALDRLLDHDHGPAAVAIRSGTVVGIASTHNCKEFPSYAAVCTQRGIASVSAFPIRERDLTVIGVMTITSFDHHGFGAADLRVARQAADDAAPLVREDDAVRR